MANITISIAINWLFLIFIFPNMRHFEIKLCMCFHIYYQRASRRPTDSTKINRPGHNICMYWTNFRQPTAHVQQNIFGKSLIEVCSPHLHASFVTLCIKIGQLFETQGIFEEYLKIDKYPLYKDYVADFEFFWMFKESLGLY